MLFYLTSCVASGYVGDHYNCSWKCEEPIIEFVVKSKDEKHKNMGYNEGFLIVDGSNIDILCGWTQHGVEIYYKDTFEYEIYEDEILINSDCVMISGNYDTYGNKIVVKLDIDKVYNFKYDTITFVRTDL